MLLGISASALCRLEFRARRPTLELAIGVEIILGHRLKDLFPDPYQTIQSSIVQRAQILRARYRSKPKTARRAGLRVLDDIVERTRQTTLDL